MALVDARVQILSDLLEKHYPTSIIPTLFKNLKKCEHLATEAGKYSQLQPNPLVKLTRG